MGYQRTDPITNTPSWLPSELVHQLAELAGKAGAEASQRHAVTALASATSRLEAAHRRAVPDTITTDIEGLRFGAFGVPAANWPLVDQLAVPLVHGQPLVWLAEVPTPEQQSLEKAPLGGTTIKVTAAMPQNPSDHALFTDVSLQAASNPNVIAAVTGIMSASLAAAVDAAVAADLAAAGTAVASVGEALAAVSSWPGQRLVVLSPSAIDGVTDLVAVADMSNGAIALTVDPYIATNLVIARAGVAVGVIGMEQLAANRPSQLGVDRAVYVGLGIEAAAGAVASWPATP
jgi:hypothetical protein